MIRPSAAADVAPAEWQGQINTQSIMARRYPPIGENVRAVGTQHGTFEHNTSGAYGLQTKSSGTPGRPRVIFKRQRRVPQAGSGPRHRSIAAKSCVSAHSGDMLPPATASWSHNTFKGRAPGAQGAWV